MLHKVAFVIQIAYHPAFDAGHATFRYLRLRRGLGISQIEFDKLRILDFYVLFPHRAIAIRLMQQDLSLRSLAKQTESSAGYSALPSDTVLFGRMEPAQIAAAQTMATSGALDEDALSLGIVKFQDFPTPAELEMRVVAANTENFQALEIAKVLFGYPLLGAGGLKDRTGLLEHRYDKV